MNPEAFPPGITVESTTKGRGVVLPALAIDERDTVLVKWHSTGKEEWVATDNLRRSKQP